MRFRPVQNLFRIVVPAFLAFAAYPFEPQPAPQAAAMQSGSRVPNRAPAQRRELLRHLIPGTRDLQLILELEEPAVVRRLAAARGAAAAAAGPGQRARMRLDSAEVNAYRAQLGRSQSAVRQRLAALDGVEVQGATDVVMNSVIARVPIDRYDAVRSLPGVSKIYISRLHRKNLNTAQDVQNAAALWAQAGGRANAGRGVLIGIIDTGIDITHPMFQDGTTPYPAQGGPWPKTNSTVNLAYVNRKVIAARDFSSLFSNPESLQNRNARDYEGHGTFVSGCAAGKVVVTPGNAELPGVQISGMAPGAWLGSYKVFGTPGINDFASTAAIIAAINAAVSDGMDVLNLSLGGLDYLPPSEDAEVTAINNAINAGVVVCIAAGNEGPDMHTISTPGSTPDAITVGAVWNSRVFSAQLHVTGLDPVPSNLQNLAYANGTGPSIPAAITGTLVDVADIDGYGSACAGLPAGSLSGMYALIARGGCLFADKVSNAAAAGASAVIVYNHIMGNGPFSMGGLSGTSIPAVMVSGVDGLALRNFLAANPGATVRIDESANDHVETTIPTVVVGDSARGPGPDFSIKPDLVAVGWNVFSATGSNTGGGIYDPSGYTFSQGTSFSTPMAAGAAAAVLGLFPSFSPADVKSALVNTASAVTTDGVHEALITQAGGGLLNMGNAAGTVAVFYPANLNFGVSEYADTISVAKTLTLKNVSSSTDQFTVSVQPLVSGPAVRLSTADTGPVAPGAMTNVTVTMEADAPMNGGFQGFITVQSGRTQAVYTVPYWAGIYVPDPARVLTVSRSATGPDIFNNLKDALAAANPGNIIEFADSQTYVLPTPSDSSLPSIVISTNVQGLPLHGITIRAAAAQNPVLDGTLAGAAAWADLQIVGVRNVLLQGLTIQGGDVAVDLLQPSSSVPSSVTIDRCTLTGQASSSISNGIYVENGGNLELIDSTVTGANSSGIFIAGGANIVVNNSAVHNNLAEGIYSESSNVDLFGCDIRGNRGPGVWLSGSSGTLSKNTISGNLTFTNGDGIEVFDGTVTIRGNTISGNESAGIYLGSGGATGPKVHIEGNTIQSNAGWGIQSDHAQDAQILGNRVEDNGIGVLLDLNTSASLVNNIIVRSTSGAGVSVRGSSVVSLVNNTIYGNTTYGIARSVGTLPVLSVFNTIVNANVFGDLQNVTAIQINYSLLSFTAIGNTNLVGDALFTDPAAGDFSLGAGSPAIDAGSNSAANVPFLDYFQKYRIASSGSLPGSGLVDMGAIEAGSSYPIVYPLHVNGFNPAIGDTLTTGIAALNSSNVPVAANFVAYDADGTLVAGGTNPSLPMNLGAAGQVPIFGWELFGFSSTADVVGGVLGSAAQRVTGFFLVFDRLLTRLADGVDVSPDAWTHLLFLHHQFDDGGKATYSLFNPGINTATVTARLLDQNGSQVDQLAQPLTVPPKGQRLFSFTNVNISTGVVSVDSDRPVAGLEVFGNPAEIAALRAAVPSTETRLFFPHFAVNEGYTSYLGVVNTNPARANLRLAAYDNNGSLLGTPAERAVSGNGHLYESASSLFGLGPGAMIVGYAVVESDLAGITGFSHFSYDSGGVHSSSAVPCEYIPRDKLLFSHVAHQVDSGSPGDPYLTGVALLNPFGAPVNYTLRVFDGGGNKVRETTATLGPHAKVSKLLSWPSAGAGFFTQPIVLSKGHIEVTADRPLLGFEMFFTQSLTQLIAVMAQF